MTLNLKKHLNFVMLMTLSSMNFTQADNSQSSPDTQTSTFSGLYLGGALGLSQVNHKRDESFASNDTTVMNNKELSSSNSPGSKAPVASLFATYYKRVSDNVVVGIEALSDLTSNRKKFDIYTYHDTEVTENVYYQNIVTTKNYAALSLKSGMVINSNNLIFLKVGGSYKNYRVDSRYIVQQSIKAPIFISAGKNVFVPHIGFGIERQVKNYLFGFDVRYDFPKKINFSQFGAINSGTVNINNKFSELTLSLRFSVKI